MKCFLNGNFKLYCYEIIMLWQGKNTKLKSPVQHENWRLKFPKLISLFLFIVFWCDFTKSITWRVQQLNQKGKKMRNDHSLNEMQQLKTTYSIIDHPKRTICTGDKAKVAKLSRVKCNFKSTKTSEWHAYHIIIR